MKDKNHKYGAWALITGANSGIGAAFADELAKQGYNIALLGRRAEALQTTARHLESAHAIKTRLIVVDLSAPDALAHIAGRTDDLDIGLLISNAGDDAMGAMLRVDLPKLTQMLKLNTQTHLELTHHFGRLFEERGSGGIVLVSSTAGLQATPFLGNYAGSKAYLLNLGMALNYEMRGTGVDVTVLLPGPTKTPGLLEKPAIAIHALPAPQMSANTVAKVGLEALRKNKPFVIAGRLNRLMANVGTLFGKVQGRNMWGALVKGVVPAELRVR